MAGTDQREYVRVETCNLISYTCIDAKGNVTNQGMGKALDISQSGLMLESRFPIESELITLTAADPDDRLVHIAGKIAHTRRNPSGNYRIGVRFAGSHTENVAFAACLIKTFHYRQKKPAAGIAAGARAPAD